MRESVNSFFEHGLVWAGLGALLVVCLVTGVLLSTQRYRDRITYAFMMRVGLQVGNDATFAAVQRRAFATAVAGIVGSTVAILISAIVLFANPQTNATNFLWIVVVPLALSLTVVGQMSVALRETLFCQRADSPRVARPRATGLDDYISGWRRLIAPVLLAPAFLVNAVAVILAWNGVIDALAYVTSAALPLLVVGVVVFAAGIIADRLVLRTPQPATDPAELAWSDAFIGDTLRNIRLAVGVVMWIAVACGGVGILAGIDAIDGTTWSTGVGLQLLTWGYIAVMLVFSTRGSQQYYLRRLWPQVLEASPRTEPVAQS
jgi:hypothetical protein